MAMCDYCDCRSREQIAVLSGDHDVLLELLGSLDTAVATNDERTGRQLLADLHDLLHAHGAREEHGVFTQLRQVVADDSYVAMFEEDHEHLHRLLDVGGNVDWRGPAIELIDVLREHILREETDLFPAAHQMLDHEHWRAVDRAVLALTADSTPERTP